MADSRFLTAWHFHITAALFTDRPKIYTLDIVKPSLYHKYAILLLRNCLTYGK